MSIFKRSFLSMFFALALAPIAALAQGGDDPIPGIDIIVAVPPSAQDLQVRYVVSDGEMTEINGLTGEARTRFLTDLMARVVEAASDGKYPAASSFDQLQAALGMPWCGPCLSTGENAVITIGVNKDSGALTVTVE